MSNKPENIYDSNEFFDNYIDLRNDKNSISANEIIEMPAIYNELPDLKGKKVLDLGCGFGNNCTKAIELGASYVLGTDISKNMIELAEKSNKNNKIKYKVIGMEDISKIDEKFDLVISSLAFHYVENYDKLLKDIYNLLNDNGILLFSQEHPINTGIILNEDCHSTSKIKLGNKEYKLVSDYNSIGPRTVNWLGAEYTKYHRNFSTLINTLINNDFKLLKIVEPLADENKLKLNLKYQNQVNMPYFMIIKAEKQIKSKKDKQKTLKN
ncbi:MAG: class I SAM-dependent methyltransferase [bacterium]|nr:class I SAM-dependent methyltransferase [bacterium]